VGEAAVVIGRDVQIRTARPSDGAQIAAIWNHEVLSTTATTDTEPRDAAGQREWLARHTTDYPVVVAVDADDVLAYGALAPYKPKPAFARTVENSVYVKDGQRGRGLGTRILAELIALARARGHHSMLARITTENVASRRLHARLGFRLVGIERETAFKLGRWHDVAIMQRSLGERP
jgi:phosphinothricin acetyltransferase